MLGLNFSMIGMLIVGIMVGGFIFSRSAKTDDKYRPQKPITQNVLDYAASLGLLFGMTFWVTFWFSVFRPDLMAYPWSIPWWMIAALGGICQTIVLPLLFSLTLPNDPINMMLQDNKKHTWGFAAQVCSVIVLSFISFSILNSWLNAKDTTVANSGYGTWLSFIIVVITVIVPNLSWQQAIPLNWQWQIQQALEIQKMRRRHAAELMMMTAEHIRQISNIMIETNQVTVDNLPQIADQYANFMKAMYGRVNGEMKGLGYLVGAVSGAKDVKVPGSSEEEISKRFLELQDMMQHGLELAIIERDGLTDSQR